MIEESAPLRLCRRCKTMKPIEEFGRNIRECGGIRYWCKSCDRIAAKEYNIRNAEKIREYAKAYYAANKERRLANCNKWKEANRERWKEYQKQHNAARYADPEIYAKIREAGRQRWVAKKPELSERLRAYRKTEGGEAAVMAAIHRRRSRKRLNSSGTVTAAEIKRVLSATKCYLCGARFTKNNPPTLDHVIALAEGGAHELQNLAASHRSCNSKKRTRRELPTGQGLLL